MKKQLIATLVAALILFVWQFLSWSMLNIHGAEMTYTPKQDTILNFLSQNLEEGAYFLPTVPPDMPASEHQAAMEGAMGKPWARVQFHSKMEMSMGLNMVRGLAANLVAAWLLVWLLMQFAKIDLKTGVLASLAVGAIGYITIPYLNSIWFETSTMGYIIDLIVQWGLIGVWLGWYLGKR